VWALSVILGFVDHRAGLEKKPCDVEVALLARLVQRRGTVVPGLFDRRASARVVERQVMHKQVSA